MTTGNLDYDAQVCRERELEDRIAWLEKRLENLANTPADWKDSNFREYARYTLTAHETTHASEND